MQVDIVHPLSELHWEECSTLPRGVYDADCVVVNDKVYIGGRCDSEETIFKSSMDLNSWEVLTTPAHHYALTTYRSQVVLVGGKESSADLVTSKLWTSHAGLNWLPSLPPMPTARYWSSAANTGTPECLVIAGGVGVDGNDLDTVEVLVGEQWSVVQPLPGKYQCLKSVIHDGKLYFMGGGAWGDVYCCEVNSLHSLSQW